MRFSFVCFFQWLGVAAALFVLVGLNWDFESEAGKTMNAPVEDSLSQSLLGYWKMDEGTGTSTTADSSGNANTLSMTGPPTWTTAQIGASALDFSGTGQYLSVADPSSGILDFVNSTDFSLTGWFNRDTFAADHTIIAKKNDQTTDPGYVLWVDNSGTADTLCFDAYGTAGYSICSTGQINATGWHHFAISWNDAVGVKIYLDGADSTGSDPGGFSSVASLANARAFTIGAESDAGVPFDGKIDDVRVYGHALSAAEVSRLYQTTVPGSPVDTGLVGHWTFDGNDVNWGDSTSEIKDVSGKGNHGNAQGSLATTSVTPGKLGQGLQFNGTSDYVSAPLDLSGTPTVTVSFWLKADAWVNNDVAVNHDNGGGRFFSITPSISAGVCFAGETRLEMMTGESQSGGCYERPSTGMWHHWVGVFDATQAAANETKFYLDGAIQTSWLTSTGDNTNNFENATLYLNSSDGVGSYLAGKMDDIRIYTRALTQAEITNLYILGR